MMITLVIAAARIQVSAAWYCLPTTNPSCGGRTWTLTAQHSFVARRFVAPLSASSFTEATNDLEVSSSSSSSSSSDAAAASSLLADPTAASSPNAILSPSPEQQQQATLEPKQIVKLFGRLADKYLLLDPSGGNCCFSGCTGCEYRLEGGGYKMADSTSSRPKWIPTYATRLNASGQEVTSKWSQMLFGPSTIVEEDGTTSTDEDAAAATTKSTELDYDTFRSRILQMEYEPPLGGPNLPKSAAASVVDDAAIRRLWTVLLGKKKKKKDKDGDQTLKLRKVQKQWQRIAASASEGSSSSRSDDNNDNNAGITWKQFLVAMQSEDV